MQQDRQYLTLFFTSSGAIKFHKLLQKHGIWAEAVPVPRQLSSSCAVGVKFYYKGDWNLFLIETIKKLYLVQGNEYILQYENTTPHRNRM